MAIVVPTMLLLFVGLALGYRQLKLKFPASRIGTVRLAKSSRDKLASLKLLILVIVLFTIVLAIGFMTHILNLPENLPALAIDFLFALVVVALFSLIGLRIGVRRIFVYGIMFGLAILATPLVVTEYNFPFDVPFALVGFVITVVGVWRLIQFTRNSQAYVDEAGHE